MDPEQVAPEDVTLLEKAVKQGNIEIVFSPVNFFEIVHCYKSKPKKAKKMVALSNRIAPNGNVKDPNFVLHDSLVAYINNSNKQTIYQNSETIFGKARRMLIEDESYILPNGFYEELKAKENSYITDIRNMKREVQKIAEQESVSVNSKSSTEDEGEFDFYSILNSDDKTRNRIIEVIFRDKCKYKDKIPSFSSFDNIDYLELYLRFYFKIAYEYSILDKEPRSGDFADLDQTVYFPYVDYIVTSDTGKDSIYPNYRKILNEIMQPKHKSTIKLKTLISKIKRMNI